MIWQSRRLIFSLLCTRRNVANSPWTKWLPISSGCWRSLTCYIIQTLEIHCQSQYFDCLCETMWVITQLVSHGKHFFFLSAYHLEQERRQTLIEWVTKNFLGQVSWSCRLGLCSTALLSVKGELALSQVTDRLRDKKKPTLENPGSLRIVETMIFHVFKVITFVLCSTKFCLFIYFFVPRKTKWMVVSITKTKPYVQSSSKPREVHHRLAVCVLRNLKQMSRVQRLADVTSNNWHIFLELVSIPLETPEVVRERNPICLDSCFHIQNIS